MAHLSPPFPEVGQIRTYTPPELVPVRAIRHRSSWTGKVVPYVRGSYWQGNVELRQQAPTRERLLAKELDNFDLSLIDTSMLDALADGTNTFDLQLPIQTIAFGDYAFSVNATIDAARNQLQATIANNSKVAASAKGAFVMIGVRLYKIVEVIVGASTVLRFAPGLTPSDATKMSSLYPSAAVDAVPRIRARLSGYTNSPTQRRIDLEGVRSFGWEEALE